MRFSHILIGLTLGCISVSLAFNESEPKPLAAYQPKITGMWAEIWGKDGWESNVDYIDTVVVELDNSGELFMYCTNKPNYKYDRIMFDGRKFNFRMENSSSDEDRFFVNYWMEFTDSPDELEGESKNTREDHNYVQLFRLE